ncbi:hypothetical protein NGB36_17995 [Streptomyces sp. RB6PN25]|uniref:FAD dependent oxidoreductase domain-containing protein n=1 Tax=Streptomyces humicola TaxID=2953240 RepID=A0ABT1PXN6_9ACTN|nr:hypothetical protein [Streptomyces humicola]MCQ4082443.1 hypothetical protein [Streptomyces humicola]
MKVGVVGVGAVGAAAVLSLVERGGMCRQIVVIDNTHRAAGVAADMRYAAPLFPGAGGVQQMHEPAMTADEREALTRSAAVLRDAAEQAIATGTTGTT